MWFLKHKNITFESAGLTDTGRVRRNNEDSIFVLDVNEPDNPAAGSYGIYIIADGMGGHQAGEVASEIATRVISETLLGELKAEFEPEHFPASLWIEQAINKASKEIYKMAGSQPELNNMGTTVTLGLRLDKELYLGHVGDSRAYLLRRGKLQQLTEDHSLVAQLLKEKIITQEEAKTHPDRGKILRCLGLSESVKVDSGILEGIENKLILNSEDRLMFCSDGLTGYVSDNEISECLKGQESASAICRKLIDLANTHGGGDNISVIVVKVKSEAN